MTDQELLDELRQERYNAKKQNKDEKRQARNSVREMQAEYDEERIETREGWGDLYDMSDDEDAKQYYLDNFESLMQDSEHLDDDWGDIIDVRNPQVVAHRIIKLNPEWIGFK